MTSCSAPRTRSELNGDTFTSVNVDDDTISYRCVRFGRYALGPRSLIHRFTEYEAIHEWRTEQEKGVFLNMYFFVRMLCERA